MSLGTVLNEITSRDGSYSFRASEEWEATETCPGGYDGWKDVLPESVVRKRPHVFVPGASVKSWHEQTGKCIWSGRVPDQPSFNNGRCEITGRGFFHELENRREGILYQSHDLSRWKDARYTYLDSPNHWQVVREESFNALIFRRGKNSDANLDSLGQAVGFQFSGASGPTRIAFYAETLQSSTATNQAVLKVYHGGGTPLSTTTFNASTTDVTVDVSRSGSQSRAQSLHINVLDAAAASTWQEGIAVRITNLRVNGIGTSDQYPLSGVVRDLAGRAGLAEFDIEDIGFNVLPFELRDGMTFAEALDYMAMLANGRWLVLDSGTRKYLDFGKFNKRVWTPANQHQNIDLLPLKRYDRFVLTADYAAKGNSWSFPFISETPFDYPAPYGRIKLNDPVGDINYYFPDDFARRIGDHLQKQRWGGSFDLSSVRGDNGEVSAFFVHAGDVLRVPDRQARGRIASKSMTIRGVHGDFETDYAPVDRLLERRRKRLASFA